jgi:hypothetical protein
MKLLKKVKSIEVKRTFVISDFLSHQKYSKKQMTSMSRATYVKRLAHAKKVILELPEAMLDMILKGEWRKRSVLYEKLTWHLAEVSTDEVGVWKKAGGLPLAWTKGSLKETGEKTALALKKKSRISKERAQTAIPGIIKTSLPFIQKDKYLLPIITPGGSMGRWGLKKMKGDIDDGCMRSIALAVSGKKKIKAYVGVYTKKK